jgi:hypothetical protein
MIKNTTYDDFNASSASVGPYVLALFLEVLTEQIIK